MSSAKDYEDLLEGVDLDDLDDLDLDDNVSYHQASGVLDTDIDFV